MTFGRRVPQSLWYRSRDTSADVDTRGDPGAAEISSRLQAGGLPLRWGLGAGLSDSWGHSIDLKVALRPRSIVWVGLCDGSPPLPAGPKL